MRRHWRKTTIVMAGVALLASAVASSAAATTEPPPDSAPASNAGSVPARTEPAGTEPGSSAPDEPAVPGDVAVPDEPTIPGTEPAGSAPAGGAAGRIDARLRRSAACGTETNASNLAKLEAVGTLPFVMTLCAADPAVPAKVPIVAQTLRANLEAEGLVDEPIGTGPYTLSAWEHGNQIVLEANPDYWGEAAAAATAVIQWNPEGAARLVQLQSAPPTASTTSAPATWRHRGRTPNLQLVRKHPLNVFYVGFNVDTEPFNDPVLRHAISIGIDRQRIIDTFYPGGSQARHSSSTRHPRIPPRLRRLRVRRRPPGRHGRREVPRVEVNLGHRQEARATCRNRP